MISSSLYDQMESKQSMLDQDNINTSLALKIEELERVNIEMNRITKIQETELEEQMKTLENKKDKYKTKQAIFQDKINKLELKVHDLTKKVVDYDIAAQYKADEKPKKAVEMISKILEFKNELAEKHKEIIILTEEKKSLKV